MFKAPYHARFRYMLRLVKGAVYESHILFELALTTLFLQSLGCYPSFRPHVRKAIEAMP